MFLLSLFEFVGTVAFAISGTLIAMQKRLDLFGVLTLATITAVGGGIFRDVILGHTPPQALRNPFYCLLSIFTAIVIVIIYPWLIERGIKIYRKKYNQEGLDESSIDIEIQQKIQMFRGRTEILRKVNVWVDAIGLGAFTAVGANIAMTHDAANVFLVICMGTITGVGGGIVRDMFVQDIPMVFKKEIYAVASVLGAFVLWLFQKYIPSINALYVSAFVTISFRLLSIRYNWNLPKATLDKLLIKNRM